MATFQSHVSDIGGIDAISDSGSSSNEAEASSSDAFVADAQKQPVSEGEEAVPAGDAPVKSDALPEKDILGSPSGGAEPSSMTPETTLEGAVEDPYEEIKQILRTKDSNDSVDSKKTRGTKSMDKVTPPPLPDSSSTPGSAMGAGSLSSSVLSAHTALDGSDDIDGESSYLTPLEIKKTLGDLAATEGDSLGSDTRHVASAPPSSMAKKATSPQYQTMDEVLEEVRSSPLTSATQSPTIRRSVSAVNTPKRAEKGAARSTTSAVLPLRKRPLSLGGTSPNSDSILACPSGSFDRKTLSESTPTADAQCSDSSQRHAVASADGSPTRERPGDIDLSKTATCEMRDSLTDLPRHGMSPPTSLEDGSPVTSGLLVGRKRGSTSSGATVYECVEDVDLHQQQAITSYLKRNSDSQEPDQVDSEQPKPMAPMTLPVSLIKNDPPYEKLDIFKGVANKGSPRKEGTDGAPDFRKAMDSKANGDSTKKSTASLPGALASKGSSTIPQPVSDSDIPTLSYEEELAEERRFVPKSGPDSRTSRSSLSNADAQSIDTASVSLSRDASSASLLTGLEDALRISPSKDDSSGDLSSTATVAEGDMILMRKMVMMGVADGEKLYLEILQVMINNYYKPLSAVATGSQPIVSQRDCDIIFHNLHAIANLHEKINSILEPLLEAWMPGTEVSAVFEELVAHLDAYKSYLDNYPRALDIVTRYRSESGSFSGFLKAASQIKGLKKSVMFEELLQIPVQRLQNYTLLMKDLQRYTAVSHPDSAKLTKCVSAVGTFLEDFNTARAAGGSETQCGRRLLRHAMCVEYVGEGRRKFRHLFLYEDALLCFTTSYRFSIKEKHEFKWYIPLASIIVNPPPEIDEAAVQMPSQTDLNALSVKVNKYKAELRQFSDLTGDQRKKHKKMDKSKTLKRLAEAEAQLKQMQASCLLRFGVKSTRAFSMLFFDDAEASQFEEAVIVAARDLANTNLELTQFEIQDMICKSKLELLTFSEPEQEAEEQLELLDGLVMVYIEGAAGLKQTLMDVFCAIELDTYGHFEKKAKTRAQSNNGFPSFDQGFEIELEATQMMMLTIAEKGLMGTRNLGKAMINLLPYADDSIHKIEVPVDPQGSLLLRIQYFPPDEVARRMELMKAHTSTSVFGAPIETVSLREGDLVPSIVRICCSEVEKRGLDETGIYRISGLVTEVRSLKQAFDTNIDVAQNLSEEVDVHAVSGCLKLYFREMPQPLFPRAMYAKFVEGLGLSNYEAKKGCLLSLLYSIPDVNLMTALHLFQHLKSVASHSEENKMHATNLATVFGPNLLKPEASADDMDMSAALDVVSQVGVCQFFLELEMEELLIEDKIPKNEGRPATRTKRILSNSSLNSDLLSVSSSNTSIVGGNWGPTPSPGSHRRFFKK